MTSPFLYLFVCSAKNRVLARLRRLREPRYLVGAVVGIAYLYLVFFRSQGRRGRRRGLAPALPTAVLAPAQLAGAFVLWLVVLARWVVPVSRRPIECTRAETDLLLTAPVSRRRVIRYKLLRSLTGIFLSSLLMLVVAGTGLANAWSFLIGLFLLFTAIRLHLLGVALARDTLVNGHRRDPAALVALAVTAAATLAALRVAGPAVAHLASTGDWPSTLAGIRDAAAQPFVSIALVPFQVMVAPVVAEWPRGFLAAALPALVLVVLNYWWVLHAEGVHERAVEAVERETAGAPRAARRPVNRPAPFDLAVHGRPEWAIVWKNLLMLGRYLNARTLLRIGIPVLVVALGPSLALMTSGKAQGAEIVRMLAVFAPILFGFVTVIGPYMARNDLRQDLPRLAVLKTWPISGEQLLRGEVLAPAILLSAIAGLLLIVAGLLYLGLPDAGRLDPGTPFPWGSRLAILAAVMPLSPAIIVMQLTIQNAAVVLFPAWVPTGPTQPSGIEAMGQQMLLLGGTLLLLAIGILPGAAIGTIIVLIGVRWIGWLAVVPAAWLLAALLIAEAYVVLHFLGMLLERTDPVTVEG